MGDEHDQAGDGTWLVVSPVEEMSEEIVDAARRYWALSGFDEDGAPVWAVDLSELRDEGFGQPHVAAAAGATASVPGQQCSGCGGPATVGSRTAFTRLVLGQERSRCVPCTGGGLLEQAARFDPKQALRRQRAATQHHTARSRRAQRQQAERAWTARQQEIVAEQHPLRWRPHEALPPVSVPIEIGTLALLRYAPAVAPISPVWSWPGPWWPGTHQQAAELLNSIRGTGLVQVYPQSPPAAFSWTSSFAEAFQAAEQEPEQLPDPELDTRYSPLSTEFYAPFGESLQQAAQAVAEQLEHRLDPGTMTAARQQDVLELMVTVLAAEAVRYLERELAKHYLPTVPDHHRDRMLSIATTGAEELTLGELGNLAWRSVQKAAAKAQEHPRAPRENMSTYALNCFEGFVQAATTGSAPVKTPFTTFHDHPLAAVTRTLFYTVLDSDPFSTSVPDTQASLPEPIADPVPDPVADDDPWSAPERDTVVLEDEEDAAGESLTWWRCDTCGEPITEDGLVVWRDAGDGYRGWRIVHNASGPRRCDPGPEHGYELSTPLQQVTGPDGLSELLSWLSHSSTGVADLDGYVDLVRRLHVPHYEHARPRLTDAALAGFGEHPHGWPTETLRLLATGQEFAAQD